MGIEFSTLDRWIKASKAMERELSAFRKETVSCGKKWKTREQGRGMFSLLVGLGLVGRTILPVDLANCLSGVEIKNSSTCQPANLV